MDPEKIRLIERAMREAMWRLEGSQKEKIRRLADDLGRTLYLLREIEQAYPPCKCCSVVLATPTDGLCDICRERDRSRPMPNAAKQLGYPAWLDEALNSGNGTYKP